MTRHFDPAAQSRRNLGSALDRARSALKGSSSLVTAPAAARPRKLAFEALEKRLLLSADISPYVDALDDGLDRLEALADDLEQFGEMAASIPLLGESLGEAADLAQTLRQELIDPIQALLNNAPDTGYLLETLESEMNALAGVTVTGITDDATEASLGATFTSSVTLGGQGFDLGAEAAALGIELDGLFDFGSAITFDFGFGVLKDPALSPTDAVFFDADMALSVAGAADLEAAVTAARVGLLGGASLGATTDFSLEAALDVTLDDPDGDGRITVTELDTSGIGLVDVAVDTANTAFSGSLRVDAGAVIPGLTLADAGVTLSLSGDLFTEPTIEVSIDTPELADFARLTSSTLLSFLGDLGSKLETLATAFNQLAEIDFLDVGIGELANFNEAARNLISGLSVPGLLGASLLDVSALTGGPADLEIELTFEDQNAATLVSTDSFTLSLDLTAIGIAAAAAADPAGAVVDAINAALAASASPLADVVEAFSDRGQVGLRTLTNTGSTAIVTNIALPTVAAAITDALGLQVDQTGQRLPTFETAQQFASKLAALPVFDSGLVDLAYDDTSRSLTFNLDILNETFAKSVSLSFNQELSLNLPGVLESFGKIALTGTADASIDTTASFALGAGLDLRALDGSTTLDSLNGGTGIRLSTSGGGDLNFVQRDGTAFTVSLNGATTIDDVLVAINGATGNTGVTAAIDLFGNGIALTDTSTPGTSAFAVTGTPDSTAIFDLGFGFGATAQSDGGTISGAAVIDRFFIDATTTDIGASIEASADNVNLFGSIGFLTFGVQNGKLGGDISDDFYDGFRDQLGEPGKNALDPLAFRLGMELTDPGNADGLDRIYLTELTTPGVDGFAALSAVDFVGDIEGELLLPIVFDDAGGLGLEIDPIFLTVNFVEGSILPDIRLPDGEALQQLFEVLQNLGSQDLLALVGQIGTLLTDQIDLLDADLPLLDSSIGDIVRFIETEFDGVIGAFNEAITTGLEGSVSAVRAAINEVINGAALSQGDLSAFLNSFEGKTILNALADLEGQVANLPQGFDLLFSDAPTRLLSAFAAIQGAFVQLVETGRSTIEDEVDDFEAFATAMKDALEAKIADVADIVPSTETVLRLIQQALGFDLPSLDDMSATVLGLFAKLDVLAQAALDNLTTEIVDGLEDARVAADTALGEFETTVEAIRDFGGSLSAEAQAAFDRIDFVAVLAEVDALRAFLQDTADTGMAGLIANLQDILDGVGGTVADELENFQTVMATLAERVAGLTGGLLDDLQDFVNRAEETVRNTIGFGADLVRDIVGQIEDVAKGIVDGGLRQVIGLAEDLLDQAQNALDGGIQAVLDAIGSFDTTTLTADAQDALAQLQSLKAFILDTAENRVQGILDKLEEIRTGAESIFDLIALMPDVASMIADLKAEVEALLAQDFVALIDELATAGIADIEQKVNDALGEVTTFVETTIEEVRAAILGFFGGGVLQFDYDDGAVDLGLFLAPTLFEADLGGAGFDFSFGADSLFTAGINDAGVAFALGGVIDIGLRLVFADGDGGFGSDFDLLVDEESVIGLTASLEVSGELEVRLGAIGVIFKAENPGDPIVALTDLSGEGPAFFEVTVAGPANDGYIAIGDVSFGATLEAQLSGLAVAFEGDGTTPINWNDDGDDGTTPEVQVDVGFDAAVTFAGGEFDFTFGGNPLETGELEAILASFTRFDFGNLLDAFTTLLEFLETALGPDGLGGAPIIGGELTEASAAIASFRSAVEDFIDDLETIGDTDNVVTAVQGFLWDTLGDEGLGLLLLDDTNADTVIDENDIVVGFYDTSDGTDVANITSIDANTALVLEPLRIGFGFTETVDFDFGLDALVFETQGSGDVEISANLVVTAGFGLSVRDGAFLVFADDIDNATGAAGADGLADPVLSGDFDVSVGDDSALSFSLFFLGLEATPWVDDPDTDDVNEGLTFDDQQRFEDFKVNSGLTGAAALAAFLAASEADGGPADPIGQGVGFEADLNIEVTDGSGVFTTGNTTTGGSLIAPVTGLGGFGLDPSFEIGLNIDLELTAGIASGSSVNTNLPTLTTFLNIDWAWNAGDGGVEVPTVGFYDLRLDMGEFLENSIGGLLDSIQTFTAPLQPFLDFLELEIPIISQLSELFGQGTVTFLDAIRLLGSGFESIEIFLDILDTIDTVLDVIDTLSAGTFINFGDLEITNSPGIDLRELGNRDVVGGSGLFSGSSNVAPGDPGGDLEDEGGPLAGVFETLDSVGLSLPFLEDPAQLFGLLFGQRIDFVVWDIPRLSAEFGVSYKFGPILPPVPLFVTIGGGFEIFLDLAVGYDSRGLETGDFLDGFHFRDFDENGVDVLELGLSVFFEATASLSVLVAEAGVTGGVEAEIGANWHDPNNDGKFYLDELADRFNHGVLCIFDLEGALEAYLEAFVKLGFDTPFGFVTLFSETFELLRVTLLDFSIACEPLPPPQIATVVDGTLGNDGNDDVARLNIGTFAADRQPGDTDGEETVEMFGDRTVEASATNISLWSAGGLAAARGAGFFDDGKLTHAEAAAALSAGHLNSALDLNSDGDIDDDEIRFVRDLDGNDATNEQGYALLIGFGEWEVFDDLSVIYGDAGAEDDEILGDASLNVSVHLDGGDGADKLIGGSRDDILLGGSGDDVVLGLAGDDDLSGDGTATSTPLAGLSSINRTTGSGADKVFGGAGGDNIYGGGGNDRLLGASDGDDEGDTADSIFGGSGEDAIVGALGDDYMEGGQGADDIDGGEGNDRVFGGNETDLIQGGAGADELHGDAGDDIIFGESDGLTELGGLNPADLSDTIYGGFGDDDIRGQFGDDRIEGGADDDRLVGGDGADSIKGDGGLDEIYGDNLPADGLGALADGADRIEGGAARDVIYGGGGADLILGGVSSLADYGLGEADTGDVIRGGAGDDVILGDDGTITSSEVYATNAANAATGGADNIFGDAGSDQIAGGRDGDAVFGDNAGGDGQDILFGDEVVRSGLVLTGTAGPADGNDALLGFGGSDLIVGGGGADGGFGSLGDDLVVGDHAMITFKASGATLFESIARVESIDPTEGGNDRLLGDAGSDIVIGGFGDDVISGGGVNDGQNILLGDHGLVVREDGSAEENDVYALFGGIGGDDEITGGDNIDIVLAGAGEDSVLGRAGDDVVLGDAGAVLRNATGEVERVVTTFSGNDVAGIAGGTLGGAAGDVQAIGNDSLDGGAGSDIVLGGLGSDVLFGRAGGDVLLGDNGEVTYTGTGPGLVNVTRVETQGTNGADDVLLGEAGADVGFGGAGADRLYGDLTATVSAGLAVSSFAGVTGGGGDVLAGDHGALDLAGGLPVLLTTANDGFGGNDLVEGHDGDDIVIGGFGRDIVHGDAPSATIALVAEGDDVLLGDGGSVEWAANGVNIDAVLADVTTGAGVAGGDDDALFGNGGDDVGFGGLGADLLYGDFSADATDTGAGFSLANRLGSASGGDDVLVGDLGTLTRVADANDVLTGLGVLGGADFIEGHDGIDALIGGAAGDALIGDAQASDFTAGLISAGGDDALVGDSGLIEWRLEAVPDSTTIDRVRTADDDAGVSAGDDVLLANDGADIAMGGQGADVVLGDLRVDVATVGFGLSNHQSAAAQGAGGADDLLAGDGAELLQLGGAPILFTSRNIGTGAGNGGADLVEGHDGSDVLIGGAAGDILVGDAQQLHFALLNAAGDDVMLGDAGLIEWTGGDADQSTIDLVRSLSEGVGAGDVLLGNDGNDIGFGGAGGDIVLGDLRADVSAGLAVSNRSAAAAGGSDILLGDSGDLAQAGGAPVSLTSTAPGIGGNDLVEGHDLADIMIGGVGSDILHGDAATADIALLAASGDDIVLGDNGRLDWLDGDTDQSTLDLIETIAPTEGATDIILGNAGMDILVGGLGGDQIYGDRTADVTSGSLVVGAEAIGATGTDFIIGDHGRFDFAIASDTVEGRPDLDASGTFTRVFDTLTFLITSTDPTLGGNDLILGDGHSDLIIAGTGADRVWGDDAGLSGGTVPSGHDLVFGDHGKVWLTPAVARSSPFGDDYFAIDTGAADGGAADLIFTEAGDDIALGQQGDDVIFGGVGQDDLIGGHNTQGGSDDLDGMNPGQVAAILGSLAEHDPTDLQEANDVISGDAGEDVIAGDNAIIKRETDGTSPRYRALTGPTLYSMVTADVPVPAVDTFQVDLGFVPNVGGALDDPTALLPRSVFLLDFDLATELAAANAVQPEARPFGDDIISGGLDDDEIFGQLGDDIIEGDGSIELVAANTDLPFDPATDADPSFVIPDGFAPFASPADNMLVQAQPVASSASSALLFSVASSASDGDDYAEGGGGNDRIYGNLGQDDLIGGSSSLFAIFGEGTGAALRPDGADLIYGDSGDPDWLARNASHLTAGDANVTDDNFHVADADFIAGDNANIYRLDGAAFTYATGVGYGFADGTGLSRDLEVRVIELLDYAYTISQTTDPLTGTVDWKTNFDGFGTGMGDLIHGEGGDDFIHAMTGDDLVYGEAGDDDIYGQDGADVLFGGRGEDGILGDDGLLSTSRNGLTEVLHGLSEAVGQEIIRTPGNLQLAVINRTGELNKAADMIAFDHDGVHDGATSTSNDIIFGGLHDDWIHAGAGSDAISGAEALPEYYDPNRYGDSAAAVNAFLKAQQDFDGNAPVAEDPFWIDLAIYNPGDILRFGALDPEEFALYDENDPRSAVQVTANGETRDFLLNWLIEGPLDATFSMSLLTDGADNIFGDLDPDWIVGGTGRDHMFGGRGNDLINMDDDLSTNGGANTDPDAHQEYADIAYDGAGRDYLILNTGADRAIAWVGEYNSYITPFSPFGAFHISRSLQPQLEQFVLDLARANGGDETAPDILRFAEQVAIDDKLDNPLDPDIYDERHGSPFNELGMVRQEDIDWQDQTGSPDDPQAGNDKGKREIMRRELWLPEDTNGAQAAALQTAAQSEMALVDQSFLEVYGEGVITVSQSGFTTVTDGFQMLTDFADVSLEVIEIGTSVTVDKAMKGLKANAFIVFDHVTDTDTKFAGVDVSRNKVQIGYRSGDNWVVVAEVGANLKAGVAYDLNIRLEGNTVVVFVDGVESVAYTFHDSVVDGNVGIATNNASATFEDTTVTATESADVTLASTSEEQATTGPVAPPAEDEDGAIDWGGVEVDETSTGYMGSYTGEPADMTGGTAETAASSDANVVEDDEIVVGSWAPRSDFDTAAA